MITDRLLDDPASIISFYGPDGVQFHEEFTGHPRVDGDCVVVTIDGTVRKLHIDSVIAWTDNGKTHMPLR